MSVDSDYQLVRSIIEDWGSKTSSPGDPTYIDVLNALENLSELAWKYEGLNK